MSGNLGKVEKKQKTYWQNEGSVQKKQKGSGGIEDGKKCEREIEEKEKREALGIEEEKKLERARDPGKNLPFTGPLILIYP